MAEKSGVRNNVLVVWAFDCMSSTFVGGKLEEISKKAKADWTIKFLKEVESQGVKAVVKKWWKSEKNEESRAMISFMRSSHKSSWTRKFAASFLPEVLKRAVNDKMKI
jgi:hypothetical protein